MRDVGVQSLPVTVLDLLEGSHPRIKVIRSLVRSLEFSYQHPTEEHMLRRQQIQSCTPDLFLCETSNTSCYSPKSDCPGAVQLGNAFERLCTFGYNATLNKIYELVRQSDMLKCPCFHRALRSAVDSMPCIADIATHECRIVDNSTAG
jgi:hypothetical protein